MTQPDAGSARWSALMYIANHSLRRVLPFGKAAALRIDEGFAEAGLDDLFEQRLLV